MLVHYTLLPNTTSKLQPLDARIISSFKRHYCQRQLEHALNVIELSQPPYKVDQPTAMRWAHSTWVAIDISVFANCWRYTTLLNIDCPTIQATSNELNELEARETSDLSAL